MSTLYVLACPDRKIKCEIGCMRLTGKFEYWIDPEMVASFIDETRGSALIFGSGESGPFEDYTWFGENS